MRSQTEKQVNVPQNHAKKAIRCLRWEPNGNEGPLVESCVFVVLGDGDGCGGARNKHPEVFMMRNSVAGLNWGSTHPEVPLAPAPFVNIFTTCPTVISTSHVASTCHCF